MHIIHKWSKWEQYNREYTINSRYLPVIHACDVREKRKCQECGKMEDKLVAKGTRLETK